MSSHCTLPRDNQVVCWTQVMSFCLTILFRERNWLRRTLLWSLTFQPCHWNTASLFSCHVPCLTDSKSPWSLMRHHILSSVDSFLVNTAFSFQGIISPLLWPPPWQARCGMPQQALALFKGWNWDKKPHFVNTKYKPPPHKETPVNSRAEMLCSTVSQFIFTVTG